MLNERNLRCGVMFLILLAGTVTGLADGRDYRSYFAYPDARIRVEWGKGHAEAVPYKNHEIFSNPGGAPERPSFQSGMEWDVPGYHGGALWRFAGRTKKGDLYVISIERGSRVIKEVRVFYAGSAVVGYDGDGLKVTIEPTGG